MNERLGTSGRTFLHKMGPQLGREVELGVDLQRLRNVDAAVGLLRRVVQFTKRGMAGSGVVPCV